MHGGQHRAALGLPVAKDVPELLGAKEIEAREGLVQEEDVAALRKGSREEHALLLAAGEPADLPVRQVRDPELLQGACPRVPCPRHSNRWKIPSEGYRPCSTTPRTVIGKSQSTEWRCGT